MNPTFLEVAAMHLNVRDEFQLVTIRPLGAQLFSSVCVCMCVCVFAEVAPSVSQGASSSYSSQLLCPRQHIPIFCFTELVVPNNPNTII